MKTCFSYLRILQRSLCCLGLLLAAAVQAGDTTEAIQETYRQAVSLQADFTQQTYVEILDREQERSGVLYFGRNQFRIEYKKPKAQDYIYNGTTLWIHSPQFKEVEVYEQAAQRISREALSFLSGLGTLRETFKVAKIQSKKHVRVLQLIPRDQDSSLKKITLVFNKTNHLIQEATLWPKNGNRSHYRFHNVRLDQALSSSLFQFKAPKHTTVIRPDASS